MAETCTIITAEPSPLYSLLVEVDISGGYRQALRPVDRATAVYSTDINTSLVDLNLQPTSVYTGPGCSFLYVTSVDNPVDVTITKMDDTVVVIPVTRIMVIDFAIKGFTVKPTVPTSGTTLPAHVRIAFTGSLS